MSGPSGDRQRQIVLSRLPPGQINRGKDLFQPGLLGVKTDGEKVRLGVIGNFQDTPESGDGGAHGVRAAASHKPAALHQAPHPEIYAVALHGKSSVYAGHPAFRLHPVRLALLMGKSFSCYQISPQCTSRPRRPLALNPAADATYDRTILAK